VNFIEVRLSYGTTMAIIRTGARYSARRLSEFGQRLSMPLRQLFRICTGRVNRLLRTTRTVAREFLR